MPRISLSWALILGLLTAIGPLCTDFYLPALPDITQQLNASGTQTQLSLTAALIGLGLGQLFFGPLSDRIGRKNRWRSRCCCLFFRRRCAPLPTIFIC
jgi:DHA1 family bicyclomycin/chloramphenicol resistance-like MFS transporter